MVWANDENSFHKINVCLDKPVAIDIYLCRRFVRVRDENGAQRRSDELDRINKVEELYNERSPQSDPLYESDLPPAALRDPR